MPVGVPGRDSLEQTRETNKWASYYGATRTYGRETAELRNHPAWLWIICQPRGSQFRGLSMDAHTMDTMQW